MGASTSAGDRLLPLLAPALGGGSLLLFIAWPRGFDLHLGAGPALVLDALLSLAFFLQHSVMVRRPMKAWMARYVPQRHLAAIYAAASGGVLAVVILLWQRLSPPLFTLHGFVRLFALSVNAMAFLAFAWAVRSLRRFDPFGIAPLRRYARGLPEPKAVLSTRGPYRWVRHPLYLCILVVIWSNPVLTADRLLLAVLFTAWVVAGAWLEEKDLAAELGEPYQAYRRRVPMLLPWRRPAEESRPGS